MTIPTFDQFAIVSDRAVRHEPTDTLLTFPRAQPWRGDGFSLCEIGPGLTDTDLPDGARYALRDVIEAARSVMLSGVLTRASA